jgi:hypothetical protein
MGETAHKNRKEGEIVGTYFSIAKLGAFIASLAGAYLVFEFGIAQMFQILGIIELLIVLLCIPLFRPFFP